MTTREPLLTRLEMWTLGVSCHAWRNLPLLGFVLVCLLPVLVLAGLLTWLGVGDVRPEVLR